MLLARLEWAPLSKAYKLYVVEGGATDNAAQKLYLEVYSNKENKHVQNVWNMWQKTDGGQQRQPRSQRNQAQV